MYNKILIETLQKIYRYERYGKAPERAIIWCEQELGVKLPLSYTEFLREFAARGIGNYIFGVESWGITNNGVVISTDIDATVVTETLEARQKGLPQNYVLIYRDGEEDEDIFLQKNALLCLDTSRTEGDDCPVVIYDLENRTFSDCFSGFSAMLDAMHEDVYAYFTGNKWNAKTGALQINDWVDVGELLKKAKKKYPNPHLNEEHSGTDLSLPDGMGYKSCWITAKNVTQKQLAKAVLFGQSKKAEYHTALGVLNEQMGKHPLGFVTSVYKKQTSCVMNAADFVFSEEYLKEKFQQLPEVYVYFTERITETHGFAKVCFGSIERLYYSGNGEIISIGDPLPEETENNLNLPTGTDGVKKAAPINEDVIIDLALAQTAVDINKYPYKEVLVGVLAR